MARMSERVRRWLGVKAEAGELTPELWRKVRQVYGSSSAPDTEGIAAELEAEALAWETGQPRPAVLPPPTDHIPTLNTGIWRRPAS